MVSSQKGYYKIEKVYYQSNLPEWAPVWHGSIEIEPNIAFEIVEPDNNEKKAFEIIKPTMVILGPNALSAIEGAQLFQILIDLYPNSRYSEYAHYKMGEYIFSSRIEGQDVKIVSEKSYRVFKDFLLEYPNSPFAQKASSLMVSIAGRIDKEKDLRSFFENVKIKFPDTFAFEAAKEGIEELDRRGK